MTPDNDNLISPSSNRSYNAHIAAYVDEKISELINDEKCSLHQLDFNNAKSLYSRLFNVRTRGDLLGIEHSVKNMPTAEEESPHEIFHSFADGMYKREMHIKAGHIIVGAIHKNDYFINVLKGRVWLVSEFYQKEIIAPYSFKAPAGVKHIGYHLEDTIWIDTHKVSTDDINDAEKEIFADSYDDLDAHNDIINGEFLSMCDDIGVSEQNVKIASETDCDIVDLSIDFIGGVEVKESMIDGLGVFVIKDFSEGDDIGEARIEDNRTVLGRYTNHSDSPNTVAVIRKNKAMIIAKENINNGDELTMDYRESRELAKIMDGRESCQVG